MICSVCGELSNRVIAGYSLCQEHGPLIVAAVVEGEGADSGFREAVVNFLRSEGLM